MSAWETAKGSGNHAADRVEREYEGSSSFYDCPECGVEIQLGPQEYEVFCPGCGEELLLDTDVDFREGGPVDCSRLVRVRK